MQDAKQAQVEVGSDGPLFVAVLVLYKMQAASSPAFQSLQHLRRQPGLQHCCEVLLWDNSPEPGPRPVPPNFDGQQVHAPTNPGLAAAYNRGLQLAREKNVPWLMLLDQDTVLTEAYARELMQLTTTVPQDVSLILPRLVHRGRTVSPVWFRAVRGPQAYEGAAGLASPDTVLQGFNSGAAVRVDAMRDIGGFDLEFPLDYLDHATFATLQRKGGRVWVMQSALEHDLSSDTGKASTKADRRRQSSVLAARRRYLTRHASGWHRLLFPFKALREAASMLLHKRDVPGAVQVLRHLLVR